MAEVPLILIGVVSCASSWQRNVFFPEIVFLWRKNVIFANKNHYDEKENEDHYRPVSHASYVWVVRFQHIACHAKGRAANGAAREAGEEATRKSQVGALQASVEKDKKDD